MCMFVYFYTGGIAAYNQGDGNICKHRKTRNGCWEAMGASYNGDYDPAQSYRMVDSRTTGQDYSNDVVARAPFYKRNGYKL